MFVTQATEAVFNF